MHTAGLGAGHRAGTAPRWPSWPRSPAAKAAGAAHLDELTAGLDLERFVLFSSIAATWGSGFAAGVRRGQRVPGCAGRAPARPGPGRGVDGVGPVGRRRDDRPRGRGAAAAARAAADGPAAAGAGAGAGARRRGNAGHGGRRGLGAVRPPFTAAPAQPADRGPARGPAGPGRARPRTTARGGREPAPSWDGSWPGCRRPSRTGYW